MNKECGWRISPLSLSGGQGKTTISLLLGIYLLRLKYHILWIDADPQGTLSDYLDESGPESNYTLADVLEKVSINEAIIPTRFKNGFLISSSKRLVQTNNYLANSGLSALLLSKKIQELKAYRFDFIIIDPPPNHSHLSVTVTGATELCIIPVETTLKGVSGLLQTLDYLENYRNLGAFQGKILGIIPFRERWFGQNLAKDSQQAKINIENLAKVYGFHIMPSIIESEAYKKAITHLSLPSQFGHPELDYPLKQISSKLLEVTGKMRDYLATR